LQRDEFADGIAPALQPRSAVGAPPVTDHRLGFLGLMAGAIACLALGVAERVFSLGWRPLGMGLTSVT